MKPFYIPCEVYEHHFWCAIDTPIDEIEKFIAKHYKLPGFRFEDGARHAAGFAFDVGNDETKQYGTWIVMRGRHPDDTDWLSTLTHECVHAAKMMMAMRGMDLEHPADEPMAYLVGFLFKKILKRARAKK